MGHLELTELSGGSVQQTQPGRPQKSREVGRLGPGRAVRLDLSDGAGGQELGYQSPRWPLQGGEVCSERQDRTGFEGFPEELEFRFLRE